MTPARALLVGAGAMGQTWAKNLHDCPDARTVGWVDIRPDAARAAIENLQYTDIAAFTDLGKALAETRPDFLVDVTVPEAHVDVTLAALAAGVPVLGEKPMADSMAAARRMVAASEKSGKLFMVIQSRRYDANALAFRELIRQIGPPGILTSDFYLGPHFGGFREEMKSVLLFDMAIHTFDTARQLSGADAVSAWCEEFNPPWSWYRGSTGAEAIFEMTSGLRYSYRGCWCAQGMNTSWQSAWRAHGPLGGATWDGDNLPAAAQVTGTEGFIPATEPIPAMPSPIAAGIAGSLREFLHALTTGTTTQGECHDNIKSLAMVFAAVESADTGSRVRVKI